MRGAWLSLSFLVLACSSGFEQPSECADYLECLTKAAPIEVGEATDQYGAEGSCWTADEEKAELCLAACKNGFKQLDDADACP